MPGKVGMLDLLYGVFTDDPTIRSKAEMRAYREYLDSTAEYIRLTLPDLVVLCGGFTNPAAPGLSEAASVLPYLQEQVGIKMVYVLEEQSVNTRGNIFYGLAELQKAPTITKVVVICDSLRVAKVRVLMRKFAGGYDWQVIGVSRPNRNSQSKRWRQLLEAGRYFITPTSRLQP